MPALPDLPIRLPRAVARVVATARAAVLDLQILQVAEIDDQAEGKKHRAPNHDALDYIEYPFHAICLIRGSGQALIYLNTYWRRLELKSSHKTVV